MIRVTGSDYFIKEKRERARFNLYDFLGFGFSISIGFACMIPLPRSLS